MAIDFKEVFTYSDGNLLRDGELVGSPDKAGYLIVGFNNKIYKVHRVIWEIMVGGVPDGYVIDHINNNKRDNRLENLRLATRSENECNKRVRKSSRSGIKNVVWNGQLGAWSISISKKGKRKRIGSYSRPEDALEDVLKLRKEMHGDFASLDAGRVTP